MEWSGLAFSGIYGQPQDHLRVQTWELLRRLHNFDDFAWVIGGDLNEILWDSEKQGGVARSFDLMSNFRLVLNDCGLRDLGFKGDVFTWCNCRGMGDCIYERLDQFAGNEAFCNLFAHFQVLNLDWECSDHRPVALVLDVSRGWSGVRHRVVVLNSTLSGSTIRNAEKLLLSVVTSLAARGLQLGFIAT